MADLEDRHCEENDGRPLHPATGPQPLKDNWWTTALRTVPRVNTLAYFCLLFAWIYDCQGGIGETFDSVFGTHALCMSLFAVLLNGEALMAFAAPLLPLSSSFNVHKLCHIICHCCGLVCFIVGIVAIACYKAWAPYHSGFPFYTMYSPHSWFAVAFICLWGCQAAGGVYLHVVRRVPYDHPLCKYHRFFGKLVYIAGLTTCALGFQDMQSSDLAMSTAPWDDPANFTADQLDDMGYFPHSNDAGFAAGCTLLLFLQMIFTLFPSI